MDELAHPRIALRETPHGSLERREAAETWAARLLALPERYRAPLVLRHVDGLSYDEIAEALDRPAGTVKAQVHRGIAMLRIGLDMETAGHFTATSTTTRAPERAPQEATR
jgi:RNA polymerase sigma factor (sigma-70 family)